MIIQSTIDTLKAMRFSAMAGELEKQLNDPATYNSLGFEERLGLPATPFDAKKASGLRFYKDGCKIKGNEAAWPGFIAKQLEWALAMKRAISELGM